ncbi:LppW family protein [Mycolicibacterium insubricum]|uniref:Uncharacterized protein n=1 Tax=Mycolicibacterium insubricum TaxID=444597 RepID=A0A1X0DID0_9MYCO|nr:hypothetical protein [Mycolicibacterium insubricum]MCV7083675.1 hypothetical protein [Mycolicibacterium insubricum]ORA72163.1 hypothetical protein BST26_05905 [Mycolicibacterium insubricum]BBZ66618.1 LppW family protein [Mycolicibacterium insubricum]
MRRRSYLVTKRVAGTSLLVLASALAAGCEARVYGSPPSHGAEIVTPLAPEFDVPEAPATASFDGLGARTNQAVADAADKGASVSVLVLDRNTGQQVSGGPARGLATASVAKLFIADDLLYREPNLSAEDRGRLQTMLRSSDDNVAEDFWSRGGGNAIIPRVAARYGLGSTTGPGNGRWWNTITSGPDLVRYYDMLLNGTGGLPPERSNIIIDALAQSTPVGVDGYPQRFGIPDGLYAEPVAVKQGWMCCIGADWMHLSTGVIGAQRRYVMVVYSLQPTDDAAARQTITDVVKTMFPGGRIG